MQAMYVKPKLLKPRESELMTRQYFILPLLALTACGNADSPENEIKPGEISTVSGVDCGDEPAVDHYLDRDGDGFGAGEEVRELCGAEDSWVPNNEDCDDTDALVSPEGVEMCDSIDNNCDGTVDDGTVIDGADWFSDTDGDTYGSGPPRRYGCDLGDALESSVPGDCDDTDETINPGAIEICDGQDNDCDGSVDLGDIEGGEPFYADADDDGFGDAATESFHCSAPEGWLLDASDCDDSDDSFHPNAIDQCDGFDQDCDGHTDSGCGTELPAESGIKITVDDDASPASMVGQDLNDDGVKDLLVFVPMLNKAQFYAGPITADRTEPSAEIVSADGAHFFGAAANAEVDVDGDGHADLLLSAPESSSLSTSVRLYRGPDILGIDLDDPDAELTASSPGGLWGTWALPAGDLTGDGNPDVVVTGNSGGVYLWTEPTEDTVLSASSPIAYFPGKTDSMKTVIGDLNGDAQVDLILPTGSSVDAFMGPLSDTVWMASDPVTFTPESADGAVGHGLCTGDLTGDGLEDLAYTETNPDVLEGEADRVQLHSFAGDDDGPEWSRVEPFDGGSIALMCKDLDGDGQQDLIIQGFSQAVSETAPMAGRISLFFGPIDTGVSEGEPDRVILGETGGDTLGIYAITGDYTGDGVGDLAAATGRNHLRIFDGSMWVSEGWILAE